MSKPAVTTSNAFAPSALTAHRAAIAIMRERWERKFVLDRYTPAGWFEMDVMEITAAGYMREYEIKLSRNDFFADVRKEQTTWQTTGGRDGCPHEMTWQNFRGTCTDCGAVMTRVTQSKHDRLARHDVRGPSRFWFVAPLGLLTVDDLPPWAGLIELINRGPKIPLRARWNSVERRAAPQLHRVKVELAIEKAARDTCYWRMHRLLKAADCEADLGSPSASQ